MTKGEVLKSVTKHQGNRKEEVKEVIDIVKNLLDIFDLKLEKRMILKDLKTGKKYY